MIGNKDEATLQKVAPNLTLSNSVSVLFKEHLKISPGPGSVA